MGQFVGHRAVHSIDILDSLHRHGWPVWIIDRTTIARHAVPAASSWAPTTVTPTSTSTRTKRGSCAATASRWCAPRWVPAVSVPDHMKGPQVCLLVLLLSAGLGTNAVAWSTR